MDLGRDRHRSIEFVRRLEVSNRGKVWQVEPRSQTLLHLMS
jgi:hypothetical protein